MTKSLLGRLRAPTTPSPYRAALIVVAAAVALAAAGCAGADPTATPTPTSPPAPTATAPPPSPTPTPAADTAPTPTPAVAATLTPDAGERLFIEIAEPEDESVVSNETLAVRGSTTADAVVSVNGVVVEVDAHGAFEAIVTLADGPNLIEVVASDLTGAEESRDLVVVYIP